MERPWEKPERSWDESSSEDPGAEGWEPGSADDGPPAESATPEEAGDQLAEELVSLLHRGSLSARALCSLAF